MLNERHGMRRSRIYGLWKNMRRRCHDVKDKSFQHYGGRGISVCSEWDNSFLAFQSWAAENGYADHLTIDRIDNDKSYSPDNCRWATMAVQERNRRVKASNDHGMPGIQEIIGKKCIKYRVAICTNYKQRYIGMFNSLADAQAARIRAEMQNWGFTPIRSINSQTA